MKIYTKTGDDGTTGLFGGKRTSKDDPRIEAYGTVDELNSIIGLALSTGIENETVVEILNRIQNDLFVLGADLATPERKERANVNIPRVTSEDVACLETSIDELESGLPELTSFILPGGSQAGAWLHAARTVARRAERRTVSLAREDSSVGPAPVQYLNRLSDLLFVCARAANMAQGAVEQPWRPG